MNSWYRAGRAIFNRRSIRYPLARLIIVTVLVGVGVALLSDAVFMLGNLRADIRRNLIAAADAAGTAASAAVVFQDARVASGVMKMFDAYPGIDAAGLYTKSGARLAAYGRTDLLPAEIVTDAADLPPNIGLLADSATLSEPIEVDNARAGTVYLHASLGEYWQTYLTSMATTFVAGFGAGLVALLLAMRFLERIIRPVQRLAQVATDARLSKDFVPRPIPAGDDEIGDLVRNFNALLIEVESGRKALHSQQEELERLVAQRTAELLAANKAKSRFLAAASHDLRQPIHAMKLFEETLLATELDEEQHRIAQFLSLSTQNLADTLNTLLDVSTLEGGNVKAMPGPVSVYTVLQRIEAEFAPMALAKGLGFKFFFPSNDLVLFTDAKLLYTLLRNIVDNAIKYTHAGGVLVGFRRRGERVLMQVWDTGVGIAPDQLEPIFDEYYQVSNPQRDKAHGLGLGLAIAKHVAAILGYRIVCRSRPGKGSTFEVSVPVANCLTDSEAECSSESAELSELSKRLPGARVVMVEDDLMAAKALEYSLRRQGLQITTHDSAESALADEHSKNADFFIVDFRLPGMNGLQFLDALQGETVRPVKAILLTGEINQALTRTRHPWKVLFKPIDLAALLTAMHALLEQEH